MHFFDLSNANGLKQLEPYFADLPSPFSPCASILVGCKTDLPRQVTRQQIITFVNNHSTWCWDYWELSNVTMENVLGLQKMLERSIINAQKRVMSSKKLDASADAKSNCTLM